MVLFHLSLEESLCFHHIKIMLCSLLFWPPFPLQNVSLSSMTTSSVSADEGEDVASPSPFTLQPWPDLRLTLTGKPLERNTT